ncbi:MAG: FAD-dependent oxidoreductase [Saprospiraceae bacterium]|nr:FAD-dependent oxidoreductase [Saprospiraceae bacterium]
MKKFKTPTAASLYKAIQKARLLEKNPNRYASVDDIDEQIFKASRRRFLANTARAGAVIYLGGGLLGACSNPPPTPAKEARGPVIAIVGGGIAGLHAAYVLKKAGYTAEVYEGANRTGGRIFSVNGLLADYVSTELGGEFIDSDHEDMLALVKEFNLPLLDMQSASEKKLKGDAFHINGRFYSEKEVINTFRPIAAKIEKDAALVTDEVGFDVSTPEEKKLDNMSIEEYISKLGGPKWFNQLMDVAYTSEMGLEIGNQSSLNFITFISTELDEFKIFGDSDERYKVLGGNSKITEKLGEALGDQVKLGYVLEALHQKDNKYMLKFGNGKEVHADFVVLALPFTKLREVDLQIPDMPAHKTNAINNLTYGTNSKLLLGFNERIWRNKGYSGYLFHNRIQNGWDNSQLQTDNAGPGGYTVFLGGKEGVGLTNNASVPYVDELDKVFMGAKAAYNGKSSVFNWSTNPLSMGSYAAYGVGQWTTISGAESETVGKVFFAGEHCSSDYQGYMNGGAESGRVAAEAILAVMKVPSK